MAKINYVGPGPDSNDPNNGLSVLTTTTCNNLIDNFPMNRLRALSFLQEGWSDGTNSFVGINNYLTNSSGGSQQKTLQGILGYKNNVYNPCIQRANVTLETQKYIAEGQVGVANGVASTDATNKVPVAQLPSMGSGYLLGPFGISWSGSGSASSVNNGPLKFAEWAIQTNAVNFYPQAYMIVNAQTDNRLGLPVIEVRLSNGPATTYSTLNPLIAMGTGRSYYTSIQSIPVLPVSRANGQVGGSFYPPTYNTYLTAWLYDAGIGNSSIASATNGIVSASAFLMRVLAT